MRDLLGALRGYAALSGSITMRAFSSRCFSDTKYFERNVRDLFLTIARKYDTELALACDENELGEREQLAFLGIYARPELMSLPGTARSRQVREVFALEPRRMGWLYPARWWISLWK